MSGYYEHVVKVLKANGYSFLRNVLKFILPYPARSGGLFCVRIEHDGGAANFRRQAPIAVLPWIRPWKAPGDKSTPDLPLPHSARQRKASTRVSAASMALCKRSPGMLLRPAPATFRTCPVAF